jgi:predicted amidophosphoribosyltransferase
VQQEIKTVKRMIDLYCRGHHGSKGNLCNECRALFDGITKRLERCPLRKNKPFCSKCPVHCYQPDKREKIKAVMKYSGPMMVYRHPILVIRYFMKKKVSGQ